VKSLPTWVRISPGCKFLGLGTHLHSNAVLCN
jgi:hypothetical protein